MSKKPIIDEVWMQDRLAYLKGLQKPKEHQLIFINLAEKAQLFTLSANEQKTLLVIIKTEKAESKLQSLLAQIARVQNPQSAAQRALEVRKKIIVGEYLLTHEPKNFERIVSKLQRPQDRAVFNLPPVSLSSSLSSAEKAKKNESSSSTAADTE